MSCSWDMRCTTCNEDCGLDFNHGESYLADMLLFRPVLKGLAAVSAGVNYLPMHNEVPRWMEWLSKHDGHTIRLQDEYGRFSDQCHKSLDCTCCGSYNNCRLGVDHVGPCSIEILKK